MRLNFEITTQGNIKNSDSEGISSAIQWLRCCTSNAGGVVRSLVRELGIPLALCHSQKKSQQGPQKSFSWKQDLCS